MLGTEGSQEQEAEQSSLFDNKNKTKGKASSSFFLSSIFTECIASYEVANG